MNWSFTWVGIKRDQRGKNHIMGGLLSPIENKAIDTFEYME